MVHLESGFKGRNSAWRYIIMFIAVLVASNTIGAIPLLIAIAAKAASNPTVITDLAVNPNDFSVIGLDPNVSFMMMLFPFVAGLAAFLVLVKPLHERTIMGTINGRKKFRWDRFFISGFIWILLSAIYLFIYIRVNPANFLFNPPVMNTLIILVVISLLLIPFQAAFEEVLFRGYLMQGFGVLFRNRWLPVITTSLFFGLMHAFNPEVKEFGFVTMMPQYILFGLIFGIVAVSDDGIESAIGAHTANNIFLCIMVTHRSSALQTAAVYEQLDIFPWLEFAALLITGILFIFILKLIFKWEDPSVLFRKITRSEKSDATGEVTSQFYTE